MQLGSIMPFWSNIIINFRRQSVIIFRAISLLSLFRWNSSTSGSSFLIHIYGSRTIILGLDVDTLFNKKRISASEKIWWFWLYFWLHIYPSWTILYFYFRVQKRSKAGGGNKMKLFGKTLKNIFGRLSLYRCGLVVISQYYVAVPLSENMVCLSF